MEQWRVKAVTASLLDVPGIGPAAVKKLAEGDMDDKVSNTYQLFGKVRHGYEQTILGTPISFIQLFSFILHIVQF
jgi:hypothetical protein